MEILKKKFKITSQTVKSASKLFDVSDLYLSPNKGYLTGVTYTPDPITNYDVVTIGKKGDTTYKRDSVVLVETSMRKGVVKYKTILREQDCSRIFYTDSLQSGVKYTAVYVSSKYVMYNDTCYYKFTNDDVNGYFIDGIYYPETNGTISVNSEIPIDDGVAMIGGIPYQLYNTDDGWVLKSDADIYPLEDINDSSFTIEVFDDAVKVQKIRFNDTETREVIPLSVTCGSFYYFVEILGKIYRLYRNSDSKWGITYKGEFFPVSEIYSDDTDIPSTNVLDNHWIIIRDEFGDLVGEYVVQSHVAASDTGEFLILIAEDENVYTTGDVIVAKSRGGLKSKVYLSETDEGLTLTFNGVLYNAVPHDYDVIELSGVEYKLNYKSNSLSNGTYPAYCVVGDENLPLSVKSDYTKAMKTDMSYVKVQVNNNDFSDYIKQDYSGLTEYMYYEYSSNVTWDKGYDITTGYGVTINGETYRVLEETKMGDDEEPISSYYIVVVQQEEYTFDVKGIMGSSTLLCYPHDDNYLIQKFESSEPLPTPSSSDYSSQSGKTETGDTDFSLYDTTPYWRNSMQEAVDRVNENSSEFDFFIKKDIFGTYGTNPRDCLGYLATRREPTSTLDANGIDDTMTFSHNINYLCMNIPMCVDTDAKRILDETAEDKFLRLFSGSNVNRIVDMEKIPYFLYDGKYALTENKFLSLKIVTNYDPGFEPNQDGSCPTYVKRSFFRLSFYDSMDTQNQRLIGTMTMFLGSNSLGKYKNGEFIRLGSDGAEISIEVDVSSGYTIYDSSLGKGSSSEGMTLYAFREEFDALAPMDAYLKIEFNNARTGQVIPLANTNEKVGIKELNKSLYFKFLMSCDSVYGRYLLRPNDNNCITKFTSPVKGIKIKCYVPQLKDD